MWGVSLFWGGFLIWSLTSVLNDLYAYKVNDCCTLEKNNSKRMLSISASQ